MNQRKKILDVLVLLVILKTHLCILNLSLHQSLVQVFQKIDK